MVSRIDLYFRSELNIITQMHRITVENRAVKVDIKIVASENMTAIIAVEWRSNGKVLTDK